MTNNDEARPLAAIVGERLRLFRDAKGLRQEDVASAAKALGLNWARSSVASLEAGSRDLGLSELLLFPALIQVLGEWNEPFIPPEARIKLNETMETLPGALAVIFNSLLAPSESMYEIRGERGVDVSDDIMVLGKIENQKVSSYEDNRDTARGVVLFDEILDRLWPQYIPGDHDRSSIHDGWEILSNIAERLTTPRGKPAPLLVAAFSRGMWGRSPAEERDARVDERRFNSKRALQSARGHVTRALIDELQEELERRWGEVEAVINELDEVIDDPAALENWLRRASDHMVAKIIARAELEVATQNMGSGEE